MSKLLWAQSAGMSARFEREDDGFERPQWTVSVKPFLEANHFFSIHSNSAPQGSICGCRSMEPSSRPAMSKFSRRMTDTDGCSLTAHNVPSLGSTAIPLSLAVGRNTDVET